MSTVEIYTRQMCGYCSAAKKLLKAKGVSFTEYDATWDSKLRGEMRDRANGGATFPQIFIGEKHVGGCDDLYALEDSGELDPLLKA